MLRRALLLSLFVGSAPVCAADDGDKDKIEALADGAAIDWEARTVEAPGSCAADPRTPSAEVARIKAERVARERARTRLRHALLGLARGRWHGRPEKAAALDEAFDAAETQDLHYEANGSVSLRLRLKLDALPGKLLPPKAHRRAP